jgi:DnaK suppressor protein
MPRKQSYKKLAETLQKRRTALRRVLSHDLNVLKTGVGMEIGDSVDEAVDDEFNLVNSQLAETESRELAQIEDALERIRQGRYGLCDGCEQEIPLARLQAVPYALRCINCQRESELKRGTEQSRIDWSSVRDIQEDEPNISLVDHLMDAH